MGYGSLLLQWFGVMYDVIQSGMYSGALVI